MQAQMAALAEKQAEQQARERQMALQQQMIMEKQKEEQDRLMLIQQKQEIVGKWCEVFFMLNHFELLSRIIFKLMTVLHEKRHDQ